MSYTLQEILSQPSAWRSALQEAARAAPHWKALLGDSGTPVVFTGCGSTWYLAEVAASLFRLLVGRMSVSLPGGELLLYAREWLGPLADGRDRPVLIAISRSGATTETVRAVEAWKSAGGVVLAVTNYPDAPLATASDAALLLPDGREQSVVQTRSFASMLVGLNGLIALLGEHTALWQAMQRLPEVGERLLERYQKLAQSLGEDLSLERFYVLGSGIRYGLAREVSLKIKETSLSCSEPFPFLEFRHGPMSMVDHSTFLIGLLSDLNRSAEEAVLTEMRAIGARTLSLGEVGADISFESGIPEAGRYVLFLPVLQLLATYRALARGLDPDSPRNLSAVVTLNL